jgi:malonyl-CoA O-methyltransferase
MMDDSFVLPLHLATHYYPAKNSRALSEPLVLLHGWGFDSRTWQPLLAQLQEFAPVIAIDLPGFGNSAGLDNYDVDAVLELLEQHLPERATLMGWSLGGMLAVALAVRAPHKVVRVITLATNAKFVASSDYPTAMDEATNTQFKQKFSADNAAAIKLFGSLCAQGDANERHLLKLLRAASADAQPNTYWMDALALLARLDIRADFSRLPQPGLHFFGERDALVPVSAATAMQALNPQQQIIVFPATGHALHWSQAEKIVQSLREFLLPVELDKRRIAQSFSRAAASYDAVASLQRDVGAHLLKEIEPAPTIKAVLDLGCGTGHFSAQLMQKFPSADVIGLDIAEGMLQIARSRDRTQAPRNQSALWICSDAEQLPLQSESVALIFSSLAIQWCDNLSRLFAELYRVLQPGGVLAFSTLGPNTLHELKSAWQQVDGYVHVNRFQPASTIQQSLTEAGFALENWQAENRVLFFPRLVDLTRELKALGAHNINRGQASGLTGRGKLEALKNGYEHYREPGGLPATYEVFYGFVRR